MRSRALVCHVSKHTCFFYLRSVAPVLADWLKTSFSVSLLLLCFSFLHTLTFWPFHPFFRYLTLVSLLLPAVAKRAFTLQLFRFCVCVPECSSLSSISFLYELKKKKKKKRCFSSRLLSADAFYTALWNVCTNLFAHTKLGCWLKCEWPFADLLLMGKKGTYSIHPAWCTPTQAQKTNR